MMKKHITTINQPRELKQLSGLETLVTPINKHVKLLSPSAKEWPNSVYSFNKNDIQPSYHKSETINKIMKNYFNLTIINNNNKNSKRMRDLIRRSSTKKLFVSNTEIKHSADKIIYTVYVFNKEKNFFTKKIYLLSKSLNKFNKYTKHSMKYLRTYFVNQRLEDRLNKIRPVNRLGTINAASDTKSTSGQVINKLYGYKPIKKDFSKNLFLNKTTKGIIYYVNSYNVAKQQPLLQLKTNKQVKKHKKLIYHNINQTLFSTNKTSSSLFLSAQQRQKMKNKDSINNYLSKKIAWRNLLRNKNSNYFSSKLLGLLTLSFNKKQTKILKSILFFNFASWVLSRFNIKITVTKNKLVITKKDTQSLLDVNHKNIKTNTAESYGTNNLIGVYTLPSYFNGIERTQWEHKSANSVPEHQKNKGPKLESPINKLIKAKTLNRTKLNKFNNIGLNKLSKRSKVLNKIKLKMSYKIRLNRISKINNILFKLLVLVIKKGEFVNSDSMKTQSKNDKSYDFSIKNIEYLFKLFQAKYLWDTIKGTLIKQLLGIHYLYRQSTDGFKYNRFLVALKMTLLRIYRKNPQINIVNLKYLHLNSDLLLEAIAVKLKNKKTNLLRTLKKALKLIKLPRSLKNNTADINEISHSNTNLTNKTPNLKDLLDISLAKMFFFGTHKKNESDNTKKNTENANDTINLDYNSETVKGVYVKRKDKLNSLRYKWITGVKIEGKGRLTKRYRADRSLFKLKYKGSLKNINFKDIYNKNHLSLRKTQSMMLLKGQTTPNIQYSFTKWKRHIGSYGIKGWISSN